MSLKDEIAERRRTIHTDGYSMSIGELMNLIVMTSWIFTPSFNASFDGATSRNLGLLSL